MHDLIYVFIFSLISLAALFVLTKLMGQKQVSQLNMFDYIIGISIGSIAAEMASDIEDPEKPLLAMAVYGAVAFLNSFITARSTKIRRAVSGTPIILVRGGTIYKEKLKKARIDLSDLLMECRGHGYFNLSDIELAILEQNGKVSFLPKEAIRPLSPSDMNMAPSQKNLGYNVIMDGHIMEETLLKSGMSEDRLKKELKNQGFRSPSEVFLAVYDGTSLSAWRAEG